MHIYIYIYIHTHILQSKSLDSKGVRFRMPSSRRVKRSRLHACEGHAAALETLIELEFLSSSFSSLASCSQTDSSLSSKIPGQQHLGRQCTLPSPLASCLRRCRVAPRLLPYGNISGFARATWFVCLFVCLAFPMVFDSFCLDLFGCCVFAPPTIPQMSFFDIWLLPHGNVSGFARATWTVEIREFARKGFTIISTIYVSSSHQRQWLLCA